MSHDCWEKLQNLLLMLRNILYCYLVIMEKNLRIYRWCWRISGTLILWLLKKTSNSTTGAELQLHFRCVQTGLARSRASFLLFGTTCINWYYREVGHDNGPLVFITDKVFQENWCWQCSVLHVACEIDTFYFDVENGKECICMYTGK